MRKSVWSNKGLQILALTGVLASLLVSCAPDPRPGKVNWSNPECNQATVAAEPGSDKRVYGWKLMVSVDGVEDEEPVAEWTDDDTPETKIIPYDCKENHELEARLDQHVCVLRVLGTCLFGRKKWKEGDPVSVPSSACELWELVGDPETGDWSCSGDETTGWELRRDTTEEDGCFGDVRPKKSESKPYVPCKEGTEMIQSKSCGEYIYEEETEKWERTCKITQIDKLCNKVCQEGTKLEEYVPCTVLAPPELGRWSDWFEEETGKWKRTRPRTITDEYTGVVCEDDPESEEYERCTVLACPEYGDWSDWFEEDEEIRRTRLVTITDKYTGEVCEDDPESEEYEPCTVLASPEHSDWSCWFEDEEDAQWTRTRQVIVKDAHYDEECPEEQEEQEEQDFEIDWAKELFWDKAYYWAMWVPVGDAGSRLILVATGAYPTGYKLFLEPNVEDPSNWTDFALRYIAPDDSENEQEAITPFLVSACFNVPEKPRGVTVYDAYGEEEHHIPVKDLTVSEE